MIHYLLIGYILTRTQQKPRWLVFLTLGFVRQNPDCISTWEITEHFKQHGYNPEAIENALYEMFPIVQPTLNMHCLKAEFYDKIKPSGKYA